MFVEKSTASKTAERQLLLSKQPLLLGLADETHRLLSADAGTLHFKKGQSIFGCGSETNGVYLVVTGKVLFIANGMDGRAHVIELFSAGHLFGDVGFIWGQTYGATAQACADTVLIKLGANAFKQALRADAELGVRVVEELSGRVRNLCDRIGCYATSSALLRVTAFLLNLSTREFNSNSAFVLPAQKRIVASMLNMSGESLSRSLRILVDEQVLSVVGLQMRILDRARMERLLSTAGP